MSVLPLVAVVVTLLWGVASFDAAHAAPGDPVGGEFQVNSYTTGSQYGAVVGPDGAGGFVVVWASLGSAGTDTDGASVQARLFDAAGVPVGVEFQVNTYTTSYQRTPGVAPDGGGGFVVVWRSAGSAGTDTDGSSIQGQRFDAAGMPVGGEFQVNTYTTGTQLGPAVGPDGGGGFVVVWESAGSSGTDASGSSVLAQRYDAAGAPIGGEFQVNTYTTDDQFGANVAPDGTGGFVILWTSEGSGGTDASSTSIQAQRFDASAMPVGEQFQVNSYTTGIQSGTTVGPDGASGFVVAWSSDGSYGTDTSGSSVQVQRFDATWAATGDQFQVNTYTTDEQLRPSVSSDEAGGFVIAWMSYGSSGTDTSSASIQGQRFDATGAPVEGEFQVNTFTTGSQRFTRTHGAVAPDAGGGFVVVWRSDGSSGTDTDGASIQAQRFAGSETVTTTTVPGGSTTTTTLPAGTEALEGRKLLLKTKPGRPEKSKLVMVSKDGGVSIGRGNESPDDPVVHGGRLSITSTGGAAGFGGDHDLVGSWRYRGKVGRDKGYKWKAKGAPIRTIVIKNGKLLKIVGKGAGLGLDLADDPGTVRIELAIGEHLYCFEFAGDPASFDATKRFRVKRAPAPATCP